jgi:parallel beta-helix repeat protein
VKDLNTGATYDTIQDAINHALAGDTIQVSSGTYDENVIVDIPITLEGPGTGSGLPVVDGLGGSDAISITVNNVTLKGLEATDANYGIFVSSSDNTITGNTANGNTKDGILLSNSNNNNLIGNTANSNLNATLNNVDGILLEGSNDNTLTNNIVENNYDGNGIELEDSSNNNILSWNTVENNNNGQFTINNNFGIYILSSSYNTVTNNTVDGNNYGIYLDGWNGSGSNYNNMTGNNVNGNQDGIVLDHSFNNSMNENMAENNSENGIFLLDSSQYNTLTNNIATNNDGGVQTGAGGIYLQYATDNTIEWNTASNNGNGIYLDDSSDGNSVTDNTANNNNYDGIYLDGSTGNTVTGNTASGNLNDGIQLTGANDNTITGNTVDTNGFGIQLFDSSGNNFYVNEIAGNIYTNAAARDELANNWNSLSPRQYLFSGQTYTNKTGNYWGDYQGAYQYNGIENPPYTISTNNVDNFPMVGGITSSSNLVNLNVGWNLIGWCAASSDAANVSNLISDITVIARYNATSGGYDPYVVGYSPSKDSFAIKYGSGYFIDSNIAQTLNFGDV